jgi:hypothetical protein
MGMVQSVPAQQAFQAAPVSTAQTLPEPQRGLSLEKILLLIIIALVVIGGSGLIYYTAAAHPANLHAQATRVAQDFMTVQAQSMSPEGIYTQATSGKPVIDDSLSNPARSTWQNTSSICTFTQGALHIIGQANFSYFCHSSRQFSNFAFQVQVTIIKGNNGGLVFRANESPLLHYLFGINANGFYTLDVLTNNAVKLLNYGPSAAIRTELGQSNLLTVITRGNTIYLYINKQFVGSANDSTFGSGEVGMFANSYAGPADVAFNNAQVWQL